MPTALALHMAALRGAERRAFVPFLTAGYPDIPTFGRLLDACAPADVIEVGVPFSDPVADGPSIQHASETALAQGITPIVCVGETLAEREAGRTEEVVKRQLAAVIHVNGHCISEIVVAYEPVWAIGTGKTATPEQAQQVHALLRTQLAAASGHAERVHILYGGSMNAANAASLLAQPDIDGGLIGGASLQVPEFLPIIAAASA